MTRNPRRQYMWRVLVGSAAMVAIGITARAPGAEPERVTTEGASRPVRRAVSEIAVGGATREQRIQRQNTLRSELTAEMPDGATRTPIRVQLTDQDRADLAEPTNVNGPAPLRIGVVKPITPRIEISRGAGFDQGVLQETADGGFVWAMSVTSPEAQAIRVHFTNVSLPPHAELFFYAENGQVDGPYTGAGRNGNGDFWTRSIASNTGVIQLRYDGRAAKAARAAISLVISEVGHIQDRSHLNIGDGGVASHDTWPCSDNAPCLVDANCVSGTPADAAKDAVAKMEWIQGAFIYTCSGGLLADTDPGSQIPYFLTANHCFSSSIANLETFFNYATNSCNGACPDSLVTGGTPPPADTVGITVLRTSSSSDYTLATLDEAPPAGAVFLGWNTTPVANSDGTHLYRISNANFGPQVYSQHDVDTGSPTCSGIPRGGWIYSKDITGATMGGSSGSVVLNGAGEVVGQLTGCCGFNCGNECDSANNWTIDGALAAYFNQVSDLLDPPSSGCTSDPDCDDGDVCNGSETCDTGSGTCQAGTPLNCNDGNACTSDSCDPVAGCQNDPINCDDGNSCTADSCSPDTGCVNDPISPCCGDGACEAGEDCNTCPSDCISGSGGASCGDGSCNGAEDCLSCPSDCNGKQNGNPNNRFCCNADGGGSGDGAVDCNDPRCTSQGFSCGGTVDPYCCGDGFCEGLESACNCGIDCGAPTAEVCNNGVDDDCDGQVDCNDGDCNGDPACACGGNKAPCSVNSDCCSGNCKNGSCKGN